MPSRGFAPSETTTMANFLPASNRLPTSAVSSAMSKGRSGTTIACAPHGHAGVQGDPAGVAAHDLDDQDALVGLGGGLQPVQGLGGDTDGRVEAEGDIRRGDVVVDGLGHAHDRQPAVRQQPGGLQGALAADRDDRVQTEVGDMAPGLLDAAPQVLGADPGGAENRSAARQDAADGVQVELAVVTFEQALPAVVEAYDLVAVVDHGAVHHGPDDGVQAGAVATARQHTNTHCS